MSICVKLFHSTSRFDQYINTLLICYLQLLISQAILKSYFVINQIKMIGRT